MLALVDSVVPVPLRLTVALPFLLLVSAACGSSPAEVDETPEESDVETEPVGSGASDEPTMSSALQLLVNGGVEIGTTSSVDWWWFSGTDLSPFELEQSDQEASSGQHSLSIRAAGGPSQDFAYWGQSVAVHNPAGMTFQLRSRIKLDGVTGEGVAIAVRGDDSSLNNGGGEAFATTQGVQLIDGTRDWTTVSVELAHVPANVDEITVYLIYLPGTTGSVFFDDVFLSVSETAPTLELQNGDMEAGDFGPHFWWFGGAGYRDYAVEWSTRGANSGTRALAIAGGSPGPDEFAFWAQTIDAASFAGRAATLTAMVRTEGMTGQGASIAIRADDTRTPQGRGEAFATTQGAQEISGNSDWTSITVTLEEVPPEARSVTVYFVHLPRTAGTVYFDDATLVPGG